MLMLDGKTADGNNEAGNVLVPCYYPAVALRITGKSREKGPNDRRRRLVAEVVWIFSFATGVARRRSGIPEVFK